MPDSKLYLKSNNQNENSEEEKKSLKRSLGGNLQKFGASAVDTAKNIGNDTLQSVEQQATGFGNSIRNLTKGSAARQGKTDKDFIREERRISNRHRDAITNILNDTFNGNLFDAGVSAINLANTGTKWKTYLDQYTDKDLYAFKYYYFYDNLDDGQNLSNDTEVTAPTPSFLDSIEDPTILGYSLKIDFDRSPLFVDTDSDNDADTGSAIKFIRNYQSDYRELAYADSYLQEFKEGISKIFSNPETQSDDSYKDPLKKNHYINSIEGLEKLDNYFVDFDISESNGSGQKQPTEFLTFTLQEDIRMFVNRLSFLYRNLSWSYNMGKKIIPENLLRFNLYIKISDYRNFTRNTSETDNLRESMREKYSRVIYELKDCEFFFDSSLNPSNLGMAGFGDVNTAYSQLNLKIKYRKVNRIFYSTMFDSNHASFLIGDKFYTPNIDDYLTDLNSMKFGGDSTEKRTATTNNIQVEPSINERIDRLKNRGLFPQGGDEDDSAVSRFVKSVGNTATKAGFELVDEGLQNVKQDLNSSQPFGKSITETLKGNIGDKTKDLGDLHNNINTENEVIPPNRDLHNNADSGEIISDNGIRSSESYQNNIESPNLDLHGDGSDINPPNENLHGEGNDIQQPEEDLHGEGEEIESPNLDLHGDGENIQAPEEDLHGDGGETNPPEEILHGDGGGIDQPNEILHGEGDNIQAPNLDLHGEGEDINPPNEILHEEGEEIESPNLDLHGEGNDIQQPEEDLHGEGGNIQAPEGDLHGEGEDINPPNEKLHGEGKNIIEPDEDKHSETNKTIQSPNDDKHKSNNFNIKTPDDNVHKSKGKFISDPKSENKHKSFKDFIRKDPPKNDSLDNPRFKDLDE